MAFAGSMFLNIVGYFSNGRISSVYSKLTFPAPIMNDITVKYSLEEFDESLLKETIYRQDASPAVDAAWDSLGVNCEFLYLVSLCLVVQP